LSGSDRAGRDKQGGVKWWRQLRAFGRASFHLLLLGVPLYVADTARGPGWRGVAVLAAMGAAALLVRAAFIYIPGFDPLFRIPWHGPRRRGSMAITFDDGPNVTFTEQVLALLDKHDAKATFFMIGENVEREPGLAREIAARGHAVGSHTYSHQKLSRVPLAVAKQEIDRGHAALVGAGLPDQRLFRAPHGLKTFAVFRHLRRRGLRLIGWTAGVFDTDCPRASVIAGRARRWVRPGSILLLHDGKYGHDRRPMVEALDQILSLARQRGVGLVTVPELLGWS
jgi:peptidoglycan/xylan/chitin deacetylase (PgdA/CDA1 family)